MAHYTTTELSEMDDHVDALESLAKRIRVKTIDGITLYSVNDCISVLGDRMLYGTYNDMRHSIRSYFVKNNETIDFSGSESGPIDFGVDSIEFYRLARQIGGFSPYAGYATTRAGHLIVHVFGTTDSQLLCDIDDDRFFNDLPLIERRTIASVRASALAKVESRKRVADENAEAEPDDVAGKRVGAPRIAKSRKE
jgi:hypothetical protein